MAEGILLPEVCNRTQTHNVQAWHSEPISDVMSARLRASWKDQGWGNRKGAIQVRVRTADGMSLYRWRRIGPRPAPHSWEEIDVEIPEEFFSGRAPSPLAVCLECSEGGANHEINIPADLVNYIASARYGVLDGASMDVTDIVKRELTAGKTVKASPWEEAVALFGDPCPGIGKQLLVTLSENAPYEPFVAMPDDACLEFGFEVGGGGGHQLHIRKANLLMEKSLKIFTATLKPPQVIITTMAGDEFASLTVAEEDTEETCSDRIQEAIREILGAGQNFRVIMADTGTMIKG